MHDDDTKSGQVARRLERSTVENTQARRNSTGDDDPIPTLAATQAEEADFPTTVCKYTGIPTHQMERDANPGWFDGESDPGEILKSRNIPRRRATVGTDVEAIDCGRSTAYLLKQV